MAETQEGDSGPVKLKLKEKGHKLNDAVPALYLSIKNPETPRIARVLSALTVLYAFSPIDLLPDYIPFIGLLDDLVIVPALIALTLLFIPQQIYDRYAAEAAATDLGTKLRRRYYVIPMIIFLALVALLLIFAVLVIRAVVQGLGELSL